MIECEFVYKFPSGGTSDSARRTLKVHSVPRVGDKIVIGKAEQTGEVKEVTHFIDSLNDAHAIKVYFT
jgi:hypothetical protein